MISFKAVSKYWKYPLWLQCWGVVCIVKWACNVCVWIFKWDQRMILTRRVSLWVCGGSREWANTSPPEAPAVSTVRSCKKNRTKYRNRFSCTEEQLCSCYWSITIRFLFFLSFWIECKCKWIPSRKGCFANNFIPKLIIAIKCKDLWI